MGIPVERWRALVNFGRNLRWRTRCRRPRNDEEVLRLLQEHRSEHIRAIGSLHSWSEIAQVSGITLDMREFADVRPYANKVQVGAGCTLERLLERLEEINARTLPTMGVIKRQTVSGIISTATHGSGESSLSHFVTALRIAAYDEDGQPKVFDYRDGDELRAARCALGRMGVILSIEFSTVPAYRVRETIRIVDRVEDALALYRHHPLTQFALVPYAWKVVAWERHKMPPGQSGSCPIRAALFRALNVILIDFLFHASLRACLLLGSFATKGLMKTMPWLLKPLANIPRVDAAEHVLTLNHHWFTHEEMEMFIPSSKVVAAAQLLRNAIEISAGHDASIPPDIESQLRAQGLYDELMQLRGRYVHHYPVNFRIVLPDDALVSMTGSSNADWFSCSLFTYHRPGRRKGFYDLCSWCAHAMHMLFGARLHWGKHYPQRLDSTATARMYPNLDRFRHLCRKVDPNGVFRNDFTDRVLGTG